MFTILRENWEFHHLPPPADKTYIFCCGPPPMIEYACKPNLAKGGHQADHIRCF